MAQRGNTTHGSYVDERMKPEAQGLTHGSLLNRVEKWLETEPFPDDTDSPEIWAATHEAGFTEPPDDSVEES